MFGVSLAVAGGLVGPDWTAGLWEASYIGQTEVSANDVRQHSGGA